MVKKFFKDELTEEQYFEQCLKFMIKTLRDNRDLEPHVFLSGCTTMISYMVYHVKQGAQDSPEALAQCTVQAMGIAARRALAHPDTLYSAVQDLTKILDQKGN